VAAPYPPEWPGWHTGASQPNGDGHGWPTLANWPGYNVPVDPDASSVVLRIRQLPFKAGIFDRASVQVDGHEVLAEWRDGVIVIGVPPGHHHISVSKPRPPHRPFTRRGHLPKGKAEFVTAVAPRQTIELEYAPSLWFGIEGSLGFPPQPFRGGGIAVVAAVMWVTLWVTALILGYR
jgi:hypothetical protein